MSQTHPHIITKLLFASALALPLSSFANSTKSKIEELERQVAALKKQVNGQTKLSTKGGGIEVESSDKKKTFELGGRFQLDYNMFDGAYNANNNGNDASELFPRRIRTYVEGKHYDWDYKLLLDFAENTGEVVLARLRYKGFKGGPTIKLGKIREDISLEALTSSKHITTISRSMLSNVMSPYFKYGASAYQYYKSTGLRYAFGVYKGEGFGSSGKGPDDELLLAYTGRLTWAPLRQKTKVLHLGVWGSKRDFNGNTLNAKFARGEVRETNVRLVNYAIGGNDFTLDNASQYGFELASVFGPLSMQAEYAQRDITTTTKQDYSFDGYYFTTSYFLTGESRVYKKRGVFESPTPKKESGAWEILAKYSHFDATSTGQGTKVDVLTLGANYYLNKKIKFMMNYLDTDVSGPGAIDLVNTYEQGKAITFRVQYLF